jgi:hypothetical protein
VADAGAWALVVGAVAFFVGAGLAPEANRVFSGDASEYLRILHEKSARWVAMNAFMVVGVVLTAAGLLAAADVVGQPFGIGAVFYLVAAVLWVAVLAVRATVDVAVAHGRADGGPVPDSFALWQKATGGWFVVHLLLAYAGVAMAGVAMLRDDAMPAWAGWTALVFGVVAWAANATRWPQVSVWGPAFEPPFMVHIPTLVIGIGLLSA